MKKYMIKRKYFLVDDNISTEKIVSKLLKDTNIELDYVSLGKEALDKIRGKEKYDLILLDEVMDPLNGVTVMKKFKDIRNFLKLMLSYLLEITNMNIMKNI